MITGATYFREGVVFRHPPDTGRPTCKKLIRALTPWAHHATDTRVAELGKFQSLAAHAAWVVASNPFSEKMSEKRLFMGTLITIMFSRCNKQYTPSAHSW